MRGVGRQGWRSIEPTEDERVEDDRGGDGGDRRRSHEIELQELGWVRDEGGRNSDTGESEAVGQLTVMHDDE